ncbi:SEC-C metal-binding domain-containing protein [Parvibaculum sp.]|uniref:SEC-C metal-binding domain-containing protein n=1 Tax=Parvibaculum sp. TaxID=2024848 RepID=UPI000C5ECF0F|nr:hypothetical protein [Parvibaculum sp.]MBO6677974.1 SEC-C domain-containing protein [Parvibaculum sp.]MBO6683305.1 SEC-C domain-containing protein [Parvibaculum sp.]MBO6905182.1 SEC-C domain-containing protein [Parvibaculum sp.]
MPIGKYQRWIAIQIFNKAPYLVSRIELVHPDRFSERELMEARAEHGRKIQSYVRENRPGRNDQCPCGAGLGFKRCHGR